MRGDPIRPPNAPGRARLLPVTWLLWGVLAGCAPDAASSARPPAPQGAYAGAAAGEPDAPCGHFVHVEHCLARLLEEQTIHCDPAAEPVPAVRAQPAYPPAARRQGVTGWVDLEGVVSPAGAPESPRVLVAEPSGVFEDAALRAFSRWRYCAKAHRGKPIRTRMHFPPRD